MERMEAGTMRVIARLLKSASILTLISTPYLTGIAGAQARDLRALSKLCSKSKEATLKLDTCNTIINVTRDKALLERAYVGRGNANMELHNYANAVNDFTGAIRLNPRVAGYYDDRLNALIHLGRYQDALMDANSAVRLAPDYAFVHTSRAIVYTQISRYDLALADYNTSIGLDPNNSGLFLDRGRLLSKLNRINDAILDFSKALSIDPKQIHALKERGLAYLQIGNDDAAKDDLRLFSKLEPNDPEVNVALTKFELRPADSSELARWKAEAEKAKAEAEAAKAEAALARARANRKLERQRSRLR